MSKTLLQRALSRPQRAPRQDRPTDEETELAVAYFRNDITVNQLMAAFGKDSHVTCVYSVASVLRRAIAHGVVAIRAQR